MEETACAKTAPSIAKIGFSGSDNTDAGYQHWRRREMNPVPWRYFRENQDEDFCPARGTAACSFIDKPGGNADTLWVDRLEIDRPQRLDISNADHVER